jgi:short-subunit dehydrogenase
MHHVAKKAFAPVLAANGGGALLNALSVASWINAPMLGAYGLSKSAAWALTNGLREELRPQHTQVIALHMGFVDTDIRRRPPRRREVLADERARQVKKGLTDQPPYYLNLQRR